jgi:hypothetical protein
MCISWCLTNIYYFYIFNRCFSDVYKLLNVHYNNILFIFIHYNNILIHPVHCNFVINIYF